MDSNNSSVDPTTVPRLQQLLDSLQLFGEAALNLETLLALIVKQVSLVLGDGCSIQMLSEDGLFLLPVASYHPNPESLALLLAAAPQRILEDSNGPVLQSNAANILTVLQEQSQLASAARDGQASDRPAVYSTIIALLRSHDVVIGTIMVIRDINPTPYHSSDVVFLQDIADRTAMSIENAQLYARVISTNAILEQRVAERTSELTAANARLEQELETCRDLETKVEKLNRRHRLILDAMGEGLIVLDWQGCCTFANPAALALLGWSSAELLGQPKHTLLHHSNADGSPVPPAECAMCVAIEHGSSYASSTDIFWTKAGGWFPVSVVMTPFANGDEQLGAVIAFSDITLQVQIDTDLRAAKAAAECANLAKSEFLSRMSHELRTPLNAVLGFAQVLQMDPISADQHASLRHILSGGYHLLTLINEVLDFAHIESGYLCLANEPILLRSAVLESVDTMRLLASERSIVIRTDIDSFGDHMIIADRQRLKQVLLNILANAVKYNREHGRITISCQLLDPTRLKIIVDDTGIGIDAASAQNLFMPFERLGAEQTAVKGTGLGLALSKLLVEAMDGSIGYTSIVGEGTSFWLEFPVSAERHHLPQLAHTPAQSLVLDSDQHIPVLLIEDNRPNQRLIERLLNPASGFQVTVATNGQIGLDLAGKLLPALILLDLQLPDLHGAAVLQRLQADPATQPIPVVIITADATSQQAKQLLADGARAYLIKPFDVADFLDTIKSIVAE